MSTPNKRRKKNDHNPSPLPARSLEHFFGRQTAKAKDPQDESVVNDTKIEERLRDAETPAEHVPGGGADLTDEQLARKLQAEWDEEDKRQPASGDAVAPEEHGDRGNDENLEEAIKDEVREGDKISDVLAPSEEDNTRPTAPTNAFVAMGKKGTLSLQSATADQDTISHDIPFDESPLTFDPEKYIPELKKQWAPEGGMATYALLTHCFVLVNSTQSRIKIVDTLVNLIRVLIVGDPESLLPAVWLATNSISPPYIDVELGLGGSAISKALKKVCGLDNSSLKTLYNKHGDAGDVAFEAKKRQSFTLRKPKPLTIKGVFDGLFKIASAKGQGSQEVKQRIVERLVQDARGAEESRYIVRTLVQHLRIGAVKTTMLIALSRAFLLSRPPGTDFAIKSQSELRKLSKQELAEVYSQGEELVKASFARRPNYNDLVPTLLEIGIDDELLLRCGLAMHIPLRPMLGGITRDLGEMLTKLHGRDFSCEFKYDGQRAQVHCDENGKVTIFSRHLEVMTDKYPDLVALVPQIRGEGVSSFILEGEVVAVDRESGDLKPFQILANRARKDVVIQSVKVDVCLFSFDLMYLNGEELLDRSFRERRSLLRSLFVEIPNHFSWVKSMDATSADFDEVSAFFKQATDIKCEGIMVKVLDNLPNPELEADIEGEAPEGEPEPKPIPTSKGKKSKKAKSKAANSTSTIDTEEKKGSRRKALLATYEPDKRLDSWLKVKKDYNSLTDTLDLIPVGAWHGQGRKNAWWSPILLACRNPATGSLEVVTKCISGFTDAFYKANRAKYDPDVDEDDEEGRSSNCIPRPAYVDYAGEPDVWFEPQEVWEMVFADITLSPTYTAAIGLVSEERGLSLRFPRFLKVREDKSIEEASTSDFLASLYRKQEAKAPGKVEAMDEDEEE
ncbi:unnamed protein product [Zymoseptoria tritici ST99CH_1E4]|uniref:DNA ligase n=1 Tax=Zymoseptoria tritici ST99CH_1E4 TaxID=1276532 RepID=A0A2H1H392_ZYMTR|nr:unnamed protein product [Zymoseptoria tritici ST99CH_1E4]